MSKLTKHQEKTWRRWGIPVLWLPLYFLKLLDRLGQYIWDEDWFITREYLVVFSLVPLTMGAVAIGVIPLFEKGQSGHAWNDTKTYEGMYTAWQIGHDDCPSSVDELVKAAGMKGQSTKDPWGNDYIISCPSQHELDIDICSNGPDKRQGTEDDVCNWKQHLL